MAQFALKAWLEADRLEVALNKHTCAIERAFLFQAREYIFKCVKYILDFAQDRYLTMSSSTRMCISYEFQRYIPLVTAYVFIFIFEHKSIHLTLSYIGASADCSIAIKPKNGVSPSFVLFVLPLTLYFFLVTHQASVAQRFMFGLHTITGNSTNLLARRPFFVFWFMGQIHRFVLTGFLIYSYPDFHLLVPCLCGNVTRHSQSPWMSARR